MATPSDPIPPDNDDICAWVDYLGGDVEQLRLRFGGRQLYIPHSVPETHPLVETLGFDVASRLCQELTGMMVYVPTNRIRTRRLLVLLLTWAGFDLIRIAEIGEMSVRHVSGIRNMFRRDGLLPPARSAHNFSENERY